MKDYDKGLVIINFTFSYINLIILERSTNNKD